MKEFKDKLAVVTGGGTGMGRELVRQLAAEGCSVAMCDITEETMDETRRLAEDGAAPGVRISSHVANVSAQEQMTSFARFVAERHDAQAIHLLDPLLALGQFPLERALPVDHVRRCAGDLRAPEDADRR